MKHLLLCAVVILFSGAAFSADTDGEALYKQGLAQLRTAQSDHSALVPAAKLLTQAIAAFEIEKNEAKEAEVNSCLYWAKKKMTLADAEAYKGNADVSKRLEESAKPLPASEAEGMFARANAFAEGHADDPLLITIHYFEVADRFKDTDSGRKAMESSLKFMQMIGEKAKLAQYKPEATDGKAYVQSDPPGAELLLVDADGKRDLGKKTPTLIQIPKGHQTISIEVKGMKTATLQIEIDDKNITKPPVVKLEPVTVQIEIIFEPDWIVFIDGKKAKDVAGKYPTTPCKVEAPPGMHTITVAKEGFGDISQKVDLQESASIEIKNKGSKGSSMLLRNGSPINLLPLIDLAADSVLGIWRLEGNALISPTGQAVRLQFPYQPPEEYMVSLQVERKQGNDCLGIGLVSGKYQFCLCIDAYAGKVSGIEAIDGNGISGTNDVKFNGRVFADNKPHFVTVEVRTNNFITKVDDKVLISWKPDYSRLSNRWSVPGSGNLFIGTWDSIWKITKFEVIPLNGSGAGVKTRGR